MVVVCWVLVFPIFCRCPTKAQSDQGFGLLVTYSWQKGDDVSVLNKTMKTSSQAFAAANDYRNMTDAIMEATMNLHERFRLGAASEWRSGSSSLFLENMGIRRGRLEKEVVLGEKA
ncbi:serine/threonine receptor-like kinase NFP [Iris pallida]|uniref:Serine/threonine receptor-like kinase NFP n=1 Tax=Iris pallida TaxID=29817 RepID=A0AAX6G7J9_IRIPA|nr:serine/threonine receptor-like kinase NFP [Iris pallida]